MGQSGADAGTRTRTCRSQDSFTTLTMAVTSDFSVYSDRSNDNIGTDRREFVSQPRCHAGKPLTVTVVRSQRPVSKSESLIDPPSV